MYVYSSQIGKLMTYPRNIDQNPSAASHNTYQTFPIHIFVLVQSLSDDFTLITNDQSQMATLLVITA